MSIKRHLDNQRFGRFFKCVYLNYSIYCKSNGRVDKNANGSQNLRAANCRHLVFIPNPRTCIWNRLYRSCNYVTYVPTIWFAHAGSLQFLEHALQWNY